MDSSHGSEPLWRRKSKPLALLKPLQSWGNQPKQNWQPPLTADILMMLICGVVLAAKWNQINSVSPHDHKGRHFQLLTTNALISDTV
ncbi:hypothetical protein ElyMa_004953000 [Elysia marginata]|uniref:Uncharacterized protein n=1 Tax=Elysia marginata TaxID=1093978 RepID=A0AAV4J0F3_9GAST|nr:hypothetical protein ElyMa_004953000 [Elysia marginata]